VVSLTTLSQLGYAHDKLFVDRPRVEEFFDAPARDLISALSYSLPASTPPSASFSLAALRTSVFCPAVAVSDCHRLFPPQPRIVDEGRLATDRSHSASAALSTT
jgi:hypothetical protein